MKLNHTYYCPDCEEIFERASGPYEEGGFCPSCTNRSVMPLYMILFERAKHEKNTRGDADEKYPRFTENIGDFSLETASVLG